MYMHCVDTFLHYSLCFTFLISSQKTLSLPISLTITWQTFPIITSSCMTSPSYILLFSQHSPVICKDYFSLIYIYNSSRYHAVFHIDLGPIFCCYLSISQLPVAISQLSSKVNLTRLPSNSGTCTLSSYVEDNMKLTRLPSNSGFDRLWAPCLDRRKRNPSEP